MHTLLRLWDPHCIYIVDSRRRTQLGIRSSLIETVVMNPLSTLNQSEQEIAVLAIEGHVVWTLETVCQKVLALG